MIKKNYLNTAHTYPGLQKKYHAVFTSDNEIAMFRRLSDGIKAVCNSVFTPEMHGKAYVNFLTSFGNYRTVEIADLLIISKKNNRIKISFLQAKKHHNSNNIATPSILDFSADLLQYDLLSRAPNITSKRKKYNLPSNILNFSNTESLRTYGTFYVDNNGQTNMLYSATSQLVPMHSIPQQSIPAKSHPQVTLSYINKNSTLTQSIIANQVNNHIDCVGTKDVNTFADELLKFHIGAEIYQTKNKSQASAQYIVSILQNRLADVDFKINHCATTKSVKKYIQEKRLISAILRECFDDIPSPRSEYSQPYGKNGAYPRIFIVDCASYNKEPKNNSNYDKLKNVCTNLERLQDSNSFSIRQINRGLKKGISARISPQVDSTAIIIDVNKDQKITIPFENDLVEATALKPYVEYFNQQMQKDIITKSKAIQKIIIDLNINKNNLNVTRILETILTE